MIENIVIIGEKINAFLHNPMISSLEGFNKRPNFFLENLDFVWIPSDFQIKSQ